MRLSGSSLGVAAARRKLGGETVSGGASVLGAVREQTLERSVAARSGACRSSRPLRRCGLPGRQVIEWNGGLRWIATDAGA